MKDHKKVFFISGIVCFGLFSYLLLNLQLQDKENAAFAQSSSLTIITLAGNGEMLTGAKYSITPDPFKSSNTYTILDNSALDTEKDKDGIITISGVKNGNYTITQTLAPSGYDTDKISKIIQVKDSSSVVSFINSPSGTSTSKNPVRDITYTAKFVCGSVFANEGPLRPGHYDSDISIFNKQNFPITILWNIVVNDGSSSTAIIKNLDAETSTAIVCKDIRELLEFGPNTEKIVEGFAIIRIQLDSMLGSDGIVRNFSKDEINLLDVQVFYTANALPTLPHEVIVDKISFYIVQDGTNKIPKDMIRKPLDVSIPSGLNEISNTESRIKNILAEKYDLTEEDAGKIILRIKDVSVGVGALIDDHAISLHIVTPQASS